MGLVEWSRFLAVSSFVLASAWERHVKSGQASLDVVGARPATHGGKRPGWSASVTCAKRQAGDPARVVAELRAETAQPQRLVFEMSGDRDAGSTDYMEATMNLLDQWANLLRTHCLAGP